MDPIEVFIKDNQEFSVNRLIVSYKRLVAIQTQKGNVSFSDIIESLKDNEADSLLNSNCLSAYAALIFEGILCRMVTSDNQ